MLDRRRPLTGRRYKTAATPALPARAARALLRALHLGTSIESMAPHRSACHGLGALARHKRWLGMDPREHVCPGHLAVEVAASGRALEGGPPSRGQPVGGKCCGTRSRCSRRRSSGEDFGGEHDFLRPALEGYVRDEFAVLRKRASDADTRDLCRRRRLGTTVLWENARATVEASDPIGRLSLALDLGVGVSFLYVIELSRKIEELAQQLEDWRDESGNHLANDPTSLPAEELVESVARFTQAHERSRLELAETLSILAGVSAELLVQTARFRGGLPAFFIPGQDRRSMIVFPTDPARKPEGIPSLESSTAAYVHAAEDRHYERLRAKGGLISQ